MLANAAGSIDHVHGEGVSFVDYGLEEVVAQKLVGLRMRNAVASACNPCYCPLSLNRYKFILLTFLSWRQKIPRLRARDWTVQRTQCMGIGKGQPSDDKKEDYEYLYV